MNSQAVLLLDIDGVVIFEFRRQGASTTEIFLLHQDLEDSLRRVNAPVFLLTHRSRAEADAILASIGLPRSAYVHCFTANDIFSAVLRTLSFGSLLSGGLRKSFILPQLRRRYGIDPANICFVDDTRGNVQDMCEHGVGYGLLAPSQMLSDSAVTTFDFAEVIGRFESWRVRRAGECRVDSLEPVVRQIDAWCSTGRSSAVAGRSLFNRMRKSFRAVRKRVVGGAGRTG